MSKKRAFRAPTTPSRYPRTARVNEVLREVIASSLERITEDDPRLELVTVTGVECEADLRRAKVFFSALGTKTPIDEVAEVLDESRVELQSAIASQVRLKRTPQLRFLPDPAIIEGQKVEGILLDLRRSESNETDETE